VRKKINAAIQSIKLWKPQTFEDFAKTGMRLTFIGEGAFRTVFQIAALPLVIKFPRTEDDDLRTCIRHSVIEVRKIKTLQKFSIMRPHLPRVYYSDKRAGVIVMEYIDDKKIKTEIGDTDDARRYGIHSLVARLIKAHTGVTIDDFGEDNVRYDKKTSRLKIVDFAY
jgi:hypothetical protein